MPSLIDSRSDRLVRVLTSLASKVSKTVKTGSSSPDELSDSPALVVEFDEAYTAFVDGMQDLPSESQMIALQAVDTKLSAMLRAKNAALWTVRARLEDPSWIEVQGMAANVLREFSWPLDSTETLEGTIL